MKNINLSNVKKILVTRTDRIGDVILSTPVFQALKETFPAVKIYALVLPATSEILEGNPYIDKVLIYDKRGKHKSFFKTLAFARSLRKEKIDIALHLHPTNRIHILSFVAGIPIRIGYKKKYHFLLTHSIEERKWEGKKHESLYNFDLLDFLHVIPPKEMKPFFIVKEKDEKALDSILQEEKISLSSYIVLFPGASCPSKMWPIDHFIQLADVLYRKYNMHIVLVGGSQDEEITRNIVSRVSIPIVNLAGKLSLKMLGVLLKRARMLISNDSGPVHIAASLNTPVISIFGRSDSGLSPNRWRPLGQRSYFIHKNVGCLKCLAHNCDKEFLCLKSITAGDILEIIENRGLL